MDCIGDGVFGGNWELTWYSYNPHNIQHKQCRPSTSPDPEMRLLCSHMKYSLAQLLSLRPRPAAPSLRTAPMWWRHSSSHCTITGRWEPFNDIVRHERTEDINTFWNWWLLERCTWDSPSQWGQWHHRSPVASCQRRRLQSASQGCALIQESQRSQTSRSALQPKLYFSTAQIWAILDPSCTIPIFISWPYPGETIRNERSGIDRHWSQLCRLDCKQELILFCDAMRTSIVKFAGSLQKVTCANRTRMEVGGPVLLWKMRWLSFRAAVILTTLRVAVPVEHIK